MLRFILALLRPPPPDGCNWWYCLLLRRKSLFKLMICNRLRLHSPQDWGVTERTSLEPLSAFSVARQPPLGVSHTKASTPLLLQNGLFLLAAFLGHRRFLPGFLFPGDVALSPPLLFCSFLSPLVFMLLLLFFPFMSLVLHSFLDILRDEFPCFSVSTRLRHGGGEWPASRGRSARCSN